MASDNTEARRERVRTLWIKSDRAIAEILIEEGYGGAAKRTAEGKRSQLASMTRNVWNDRKALRQQWRSMKRATIEDAHESRGEYVAVLDSLQDIGVEMLSDSKLKGTPKAQALQAVTRIVEARGKALGVAEIAAVEPETDDEKRPAVLGLVVSAKNLSPEMTATLRAQGYDFDDDNGGGSTP